MRKIHIISICLGVVLLLSLMIISEALFNVGIPFVSKRYIWSVGIYTGNTPFDLSPAKDIANPVMTAEMVDDVRARFVADPFMVQEEGEWYMFFEVLNLEDHKGDIGLAVSDDGFTWKYEKIVLNEPFHLSYPYVFKSGDDYYMIPESYEVNSVRLYKAADFPVKWEPVGTLLEGRPFLDNSVFQYNGKWWLFSSTPRGNLLWLYYAEDINGPWTEHPKSPVVKENANIARPGGRVLVWDGRIFRFTQDDAPSYGKQVFAFELTRLTEEDYEEVPVGGDPVIKASGEGWNAEGMHHADPSLLDDGSWISCVDGYVKKWVVTH